tara:strand:- start:431 stop:724 length:294 start_codon:yes stop_codon:yes gene_type:complete
MDHIDDSNYTKPSNYESLPENKSYIHNSIMPKQGDLVICPYWGLKNIYGRLAIVEEVVWYLIEHRVKRVYDISCLKIKFLDNGKKHKSELKYWHLVQ